MRHRTKETGISKTSPSPGHHLPVSGPVGPKPAKAPTGFPSGRFNGRPILHKRCRQHNHLNHKQKSTVYALAWQRGAPWVPVYDSVMSPKTRVNRRAKLASHDEGVQPNFKLDTGRSGANPGGLANGQRKPAEMQREGRSGAAEMPREKKRGTPVLACPQRDSAILGSGGRGRQGLNPGSQARQFARHGVGVQDALGDATVQLGLGGAQGNGRASLAHSPASMCRCSR